MAKAEKVNVKDSSNEGEKPVEIKGSLFGKPTVKPYKTGKDLEKELKDRKKAEEKAFSQEQ